MFNFGRKEVRNFLVANALYWLEAFHIDGIRVDAVASMLYLDYSREEGQWQPNVHGGRENLEAEHFLKELNGTIYKRVPGAITIAEESTSWPGVTKPTSADGLGFGFKWNMGWMHDSLEYVGRDPIHRGYHHNQLTFSMVYAFSEHYVLPISHDEVVHGKGSLLRKMPGDRWQQLASVRAFLSWQWAHPGKQLLFMGQEFAQANEWAEQRALDWHLLDDPNHAGVSRLVADLNSVYADNPALWSQDSEGAGFQWLDADDAARNTVAFLRWGSDGSPLVCVTNFSAIPHENYELGASVRGRLDRGDQQRRRDLRRFRCRQPRHGHRARDATRRPARLRATAGAAARHALAHQSAPLTRSRSRAAEPLGPRPRVAVCQPRSPPFLRASSVSPGPATCRNRDCAPPRRRSAASSSRPSRAAPRGSRRTSTPTTRQPNAWLPSRD